ncbi:hypothetical protein FA15DRAFT_674791 [Coprinopsis marcescibilis]|uniref:Uncharacterized protein n=1 Tax=Coprinopsis marcescibilis TaxID=230819 RepID=A0A5C3KT98_COPMA|nr:hypothetical protein FA15DRAFT_674791 [Coprinopsis marcescibilis]
MPSFKSQWINIFGGEFLDVERDLHVHSRFHFYPQQAPSTDADSRPLNDLASMNSGVHEHEDLENDAGMNFADRYDSVPLASASTYIPIPSDTNRDGRDEESLPPGIASLSTPFYGWLPQFSVEY